MFKLTGSFDRVCLMVDRFPCLHITYSAATGLGIVDDGAISLGILDDGGACIKGACVIGIACLCH